MMQNRPQSPRRARRAWRWWLFVCAAVETGGVPCNRGTQNLTGNGYRSYIKTMQANSCPNPSPCMRHDTPEA